MSREEELKREIEEIIRLRKRNLSKRGLNLKGYSRLVSLLPLEVKQAQLKGFQEGKSSAQQEIMNSDTIQNEITEKCLKSFELGKKEAKQDEIEEQLRWMEKQIVSKHPIDFYNRTVELKQRLQELKK